MNPIEVVQNPIVFYWLEQSGILSRIAHNIEIEYKCEFSYQQGTLNPKVLGENASIEDQIVQEIIKELEDLQASSPMQTFDFGTTNPAEVDERLRRLREKHEGESIFIVNPQEEHKSIRACLEKYRLAGLLREYDNYYSLQNSLYLFTEQPLQQSFQQSFLEMVSEGDLQKQTIGLGKQENLLESYAEKIDHKIEHLEIGSKLTEFDGVELWKCTYKSIPHTYMKCIKDSSWLQGLNKPLLHNCHPKTVANLPLLPPLTLVRPRPEHVPTLLGFLNCLQKKYPTHSPQINSIFEHQGRLVVFTKESWPADRGWLCYRVAYGEVSYQGYLNWLKNHPNDPVARATVHEAPLGSTLTL